VRWHDTAEIRDRKIPGVSSLPSGAAADAIMEVTIVPKRTAAMVDLMNLEEQVDREFTAARRRARIGRLRAILHRKPAVRTLLPFEEQRRSWRAYGGIHRGRTTVEISRIVGSAGKHDYFDEAFMPLRSLSRDRWKRIDRAFRLGHEFPPVTLYKLGKLYFVKDGHHRVSVARFHGAEWIDAEVTEFRSPGNQSSPQPASSIVAS
jgi:hypothetical protein